ncbi:MAG: hypothetical protein ABSA47_14800 [Verrucomicrobiota bacterium]|jgi:hypothetical protein
MTPSRILPDLQCSLLCEEVRQERGGSFILIGVLHTVTVPEVPVTAPRICVFNRWTAGFGKFLETVRLIAPDQVTVLRKHESRFELKDVTLHAINVVYLGQVKFEVAGPYYIEVLVDDVMKIRYPLVIHHVPPPAPPSETKG